MAHVIAESSFEKPFTEEEENRGAKEIDRSLEKTGSHWIRSYYSEDRRRMICEFEAADAESVRSAYTSAGVPLERVWLAVVFAGESLKAD
ncbi:MAG TPA: nickel-binding protein [Fibrobacteria bacterium]|nr:nickel-binding protein [Fibrobacteria bacterium]